MWYPLFTTIPLSYVTFLSLEFFENIPLNIMRILLFMRGAAAGVATLPTTCMSDPPLPLVAGDLVAAQ